MGDSSEPFQLAPAAQQPPVQEPSSAPDLPQADSPPTEPAEPVSEPQDAPQEPSTLPQPPAPVLVAQAQPVRVDNVTRRSGADALEGLFCEIVAGEYAGRWGVFDHVVARDVTGYPKLIMVITRDERNERLTVKYGDVRPSPRHGGR